MAAPDQGRRAQDDPSRRGPRVNPWDEDRRQGEAQEAWILTYIDMLTLLLALFVVLLTYAQFLPERYAQLTRSMASALQGEPVKSADSGEHPAAARLKQAILAQDLNDRVGISLEKGKINLEIKDNILFVQGSADLTAPGLELLDKLVPILQDNGFPVSVEGHTDNLPINTSRFPSNWELSAGRASTVVRHLISQGVAQRRLRAIGRADTVPVADNDSDAGRALNRRVILVVHMDMEEQVPQAAPPPP